MRCSDLPGQGVELGAPADARAGWAGPMLVHGVLHGPAHPERLHPLETPGRHIGGRPRASRGRPPREALPRPRPPRPCRRGQQGPREPRSRRYDGLHIMRSRSRGRPARMAPAAEGAAHDRAGRRAPRDFADARAPEGRREARPGEHGRDHGLAGLHRIGVDGARAAAPGKPYRALDQRHPRKGLYVAYPPVASGAAISCLDRRGGPAHYRPYSKAGAPDRSRADAQGGE